jgi:hypothetical protein
VGGLSADDHRLHVQVVGEPVVLGLVLTVDGERVELTATVAGGAVESARGWEDAKRLQDQAFARAEALGGELTATGLVRLPVEALGRAPLGDLHWTVESVELWVDGCGGPASWRVLGVLRGGGPFWSPARVEAGQADAWEARLRQAAERLAARFVLVQP